MKIVIEKLYTKDIEEVKVFGVRKSADCFVRDMEIVMKTGEVIDISIYSEEKAYCLPLKPIILSDEND